jgi:AraC-like DNA-binding protein
MVRRRRVRQSYPKPVVDLAMRLIPVHGVAAACRMLDIPMSVAYRWRKTAGVRVGLPGNPAAEAHALAALVAQCAALGFAVTAYARGSDTRTRSAVGAPATNPARYAQPGHGLHVQAGNSCNGPLRNHGEGVGAWRSAPATTDAGAAATPQPAASAQGARRYVFDAGRERPVRAVRPRMEAVRNAIDTRYFLEVDCRTLAATAGMSLHHFIRVFRDMFGLSPHQYLLRARVNAAKRLLLSTFESIDLIAVGVGFHSGPSLNRAFKRIEGSTVSRYCQMAKKASPGAKPRASIPGPAPRGSAPPAV